MGIFLYLWLFGSLLISTKEILVGYQTLELQWIFVLCLLTGYGLTCLVMGIASVGLLIKHRWGRILALICLPLILLLSAYMSAYSLPFLWIKYNPLEDAWPMETVLLLLPVVMVLYSIWGLIQLLAARSKTANVT